jgi:hypothetical protein
MSSAKKVIHSLPLAERKEFNRVLAIPPENLSKDTTHVAVQMLEDVVFPEEGADGPLLLEKDWSYELGVESCDGAMTPHFYVPSQSKNRKGVEVLVPTTSFIILSERTKEYPPVIEDWSKGFKK